MVLSLERFIINDLWGERQVALEFTDNNLIIVGENGSGKTTILRILYETLACKWAQLSMEEFSSITLIANYTQITIERENILCAQKMFIDMDSEIWREIPPGVRRRVQETSDLSGKSITLTDLEEFLHEYGYDEYISKIHNYSKDTDLSVINEYTEKILSIVDYRIIYMPSYRRVEKALGFKNERPYYPRSRRIMAYQDFPERIANERTLEIAKTGMDDVEYYIKATLYEIKRRADMSGTRLNYQCFKGILNKTSYDVTYNSEILKAESIEKVFGSINEEVLSPEESEQIKKSLIDMKSDEAPDPQSYEQIVYYFYHMLYERYQQIKKSEKTIHDYFDACNAYLVNKCFEYDEKDFTYRIIIQNKDAERFTTLENLSSGEKQIVSMFSYLYLSPLKQSIILIDEPELSLSVPWQRKYLLDINDGPSCAGLITVTHSPFVFDNRLKKYARSLEEFIF